ncbi:MAG: HAD-IA family hydrolase [Candidatus Bathyarchaeia archaeon]|jgi:HAD superfamily hydrolase (TIGR01549 family)
MNVAVLFDLEDTLVKTPWSVRQHVLEFRRDTRRKLIDLGIPKTVLEGIKRATIMRNIASEYVQRHLGEERARVYRREMETFLNHYELDSARKSRLFPETISTLQTLRELGAKIGLVTNTSRRAADVVFEIHGLKEYFDVVVTREDVTRLKPDPEGVLLAARKLGATRFFLVGDLMLDVLAAKGANGVAIMVTRDLEKSDSNDLFRSLPEILNKNQRAPGEGRGFQADYVIKSLREVPAIVRAEERKDRC